MKIGAIFAVTGPNANLGTPEARTLQMLVDDANRAGGIAGQKVELILKDSQGSAEKAVSFAKQLIEEDDVLAIIGPSTSGESMKLKGLCNDAGDDPPVLRRGGDHREPRGAVGVQGRAHGQLRGADDLLPR